MFNQQSNNSSFGSGSFFRSSNNQSSNLGGNMFGNQNSSFNKPFSSTGSGFNSSASQGKGTTISSYSLTSSRDYLNGRMVTTKFHTINAMNQYKDKSHTELRLEDYFLNRKKNFGSQNSWFGSSNTSSTGQGLFGQKTSSLFSNTQNQASGGSLFGNNQANTNTFGSSSLFSNKPASGGLFGSQSNQTSSLFGSSNKQQTNLFSNTTNNSNNQKTVQFGSNNNTNSMQPFGGGSVFSNTSNQFGNTTGSKSIFGTSQNQQSNLGTGGLFSSTNQAQTGSLFGSQNTQQAGQTGGLSFNCGQLASGGLFGSSNSAQNATSSAVNTGASNTGSNLFGSGSSNIGLGFGNSSKPAGSFNFSFNNQNNNSSNQQNSSGLLFGSGSTQSQTNQKMGSINTNVSPNPLSNIMILSSPYSNSLKIKATIDETTEENTPKPTKIFSENSTNTTKLKKLILKSAEKEKFSPRFEISDKDLGFSSYKPKIYTKNQESCGHLSLLTESHSKSTPVKNTSLSNQTPKSNNELEMIKDGMVSINYEDELIQSILINTSQKIGSDVTFLNMSQTLRPTEKSFNKTITDIVFQSNISNDQNMMVDTNKNYLSDNTDDDRPLHPAGIISTRNDYYTIPSLDKIAELVDVGNDECIIEDLVIGREGYGMLKFPGKTNVMNLNIDRDIYFKKRKVSVYTDNTNKPPRGTALNKECNITLFNVYPASRKQKDIKVDLNERDLKLFIDKLKGECKRWDAKYVNYDYEKGAWSFIVKHFSEYGFEDSEDSTSSISVQDLENDNSQEYSNNSFGLSDTKSHDSNILNCSTSINFSDLNYSIIESENLSEKTDVDMKTNSNDYKRFKHGAPYACQMMNFTNNLLYISQDNKISTQQSDINPLKYNNFFSQGFPYQIQNIFNNINNKSLNDSILSLEKSANDLNSEFDSLKSSINLIKMLYFEDNESNTSFYEMLNDYLIEINSLLLENIDPDQIATDNSDSKKLLYSIKVLISIGDIKSAAEIVKNQFNSPRLSFLLLGCRNNKKCQQVARQQLLFWHQDDLLKLIPSHIVELYLLISGTSTWSSVYNLNICKDLIWTQSFAIYLNYACNNSMSKSEIVQNFLEWYSLPNLMNIKVSNNLENDLSFIAEKPLPLHIYTDKPNLEHENSFQIIKDFIDIRYSLLKFFVYQSIDLINLEYHCFSKYRVVGMISSSIIGSFIMKNIKYLPKLFEASQHNLIKLSINLQQYGLLPFSAIILDQLQNEILFRTYADAMIMQNYYRITENPEVLMNMNLSQRFKELISANLVSSTDHSLNIIQILNKSLLYSPRFVQDMMNNLFIVLALNDSSLISQLSKTISHFISNSGLKNISLINQLYLLVGVLDDFSLQLSNNLPDQNYLNLAQKVDQCQLLETETKVLIFSKIYEDCRFRFPVDVCV